MSKPVKKLFDLEIDEVSVVDRAANQHSLIAFSKSLGGDLPLEGSMPELAIYDETDEQVDIDDLEHGDVVYDEQGNEYVFLEDDGEDEVGKASRWKSSKKAVDWMAGQGNKNALANQRRAARAAEANAPAERTLSQRLVNYKAKKKHGLIGPNADVGIRRGASEGWKAGRTGNDFGVVRNSMNRQGGVAYDVARNVGGNLPAYAVGTGALTTAGGLAAYEHGRAKKSLGEDVLEALSKAVTEDDREFIIAKAMDEIEIAKAAAAEAWEYAEEERDIRVTQEFISKAATYNLPVHPEVLGPILKAMAETLDDEQLEIIDEIFNAVGDALYNEVGFVGESSNSSVIDAVSAYADDLVGKSNLTHEQATVAMFEANPAAYDAYISEKGI